MEDIASETVKGAGELMGKITEKGVVSVHIVAFIVVGAIWTTRLSDRVDRLETSIIELTSVKKEIGKIEDKMGIKHGGGQDAERQQF